jgi:hypothetical protein
MSQPYVVAGTCARNATVREACRVAIRYLRALDLDRPRTACAQLAQDTLDNAGGMRGCVATLETTRGTRIRYVIHAAVTTVAGTSVRFRTRAIDGTGPGIDQVMVLHPEEGRQRIVIVMADPSAAASALGGG